MTEKAVPVIILVTVIPWLSKLLQSSIMKRFLPTGKDKIGLGRIIGWGLASCENFFVQK
jgi:hypothetical protein